MSWHIEGNTFVKAQGMLQTPYDKLSLIEGNIIFTQNPTDSSVSLDFQLTYAPGQQIMVSLHLEGNILTVDMDMPIEGLRLVWQLGNSLDSAGWDNMCIPWQFFISTG